MERKDTVTMTLPKKYQQAMQDLLGEEYSAYIESMQQRSQTAIRINTAKISLEQWAEICPFKTKPVPWTENNVIPPNILIIMRACIIFKNPVR